MSTIFERNEHMDEYLIYPKQFQRVSVPVEKNRCFMIMPFKDKLNRVYGAIKSELNKAGYVCNRVDEIGGATPIINKILTEILRSRCVIADLTDCNPNVFYELGVAHSFKEAQNIIILKQKGSYVPFDITHLKYIEYDPDNMIYLTSEIIEEISSNSYMADFREALNIRGIISYVKNDEESFIEYLERKLPENLPFLISILNNEIRKYNSEDIERFLSEYEKLLGYTIVKEPEEIINGLLAVYREILISLAMFPVTERSVRAFLDDSFGEHFNTNKEKMLIWKTDLAIALAKANKMMDIILPWIIQYFSQTKTASIDLNRYKLEAFLMTDENIKTNDVICNAIFDSNCYIREHMADIVGEKQLHSGVNNLCRQLTAEENFYTAVSIMEALGKLRNPIALNYILKWIQNNEKKVLSEKQYFVLKHARVALAKLTDDTTEYNLIQFDEKYQKYLQDYFIY